MAEEVVFRDVMKAAYDYAATAEDELTMKEDQLLYLLGNLDDDWAKVQVHTPLELLSEAEPAAGLVPSAYIEPAPPLYRAVALYDYDPNGEGEVLMKENEKMSVYLKEDDWILVKIDRKGTVSKPAIGYVPANYVEEGEGDGEAQEEAPVAAAVPIPPTPGTPTAQADNAERAAAAAAKLKEDPVAIFHVSEIDKKGKKKKGTLGVGNGSIFFASESDKAPVQKWQVSSVTSVSINEDKHKHVNLEISGPSGDLSLEFGAGSRDDAQAIVDKVERSKRLALGESSPPSKSPEAPASTIKSPTPSAPNGDGEDELTVKEGEKLTVVDKEESEEWWKCRNSKGKEGVVPASYLEARAQIESADEGDDNAAAEAAAEAARAEAARKEQEQAAAAAAKAKRLADESRRKREQEAREAQEQQEREEREEAEAKEAEAQRQKEERERRAREARRREAEAQAQASSKSSTNGTPKKSVLNSFFKFVGPPNSAAGHMGVSGPGSNRSRSPAPSETSSATDYAGSERGKAKNPSLATLAFGTPRSGGRARSASPVGSPRDRMSPSEMSSGPSSPISSPLPLFPSTTRKKRSGSSASVDLPSSSKSFTSSSSSIKASSVKLPPSKAYASIHPRTPPTKSHTLPPSYMPPLPRSAPPISPPPPRNTRPVSPPPPRSTRPVTPPVPRSRRTLSPPSRSPPPLSSPSLSPSSSPSPSPPPLRRPTVPLVPPPQKPGPPGLVKPFSYTAPAAQTPFNYLNPAAPAPFSYLTPSNNPPPYLLKARNISHGRGQSKDLPGRPSLDKPKPTNTRIWHDRSGQFKVEAQFLGIHNNKVRLHKANGVIIEVPEEKMSATDMEYIRKAGRNPTSPTSPDEDNVPLGALPNRRSTQGPPSSSRSQAPLRKSHIDWFEFFLNAGCDLDDCTRYATTFEREKIDESILPDLKPETLRGLNLREGDIIRVMKQIEQRGWKVQSPRSADPKVQEQMKKDAELAARLQEEEFGRKTPVRNNTASPGLFTSGPGGTLKNNTRRGRPAPTKAATLTVDASGIASASEQLSRTKFDVLAKLGTMRPPSAPAQPMSAPLAPTISPPPVGFQQGMGMGASPAPMGSLLQAQATGALSPLQAAGGPRAPYAPVPQNEGLLKPLIPTTTGFNSFVPTRPGTAPATSLPNAGTPSFLTTQPTGFNPSFNPAPQPTMSPLVPNPTGFAPSSSPFQPASATSSGFSTASYASANSAFQAPSPLATQPTGFGNPGAGSGFGNPGAGSGFGSQFGGVNPGSNFLNTVSSQPTGMFSGPPNVNPAPDTNAPANVFAAMKAGSFANAAAPQSGDRYDALRPQPTGWNALGAGVQPQPTGFNPGFGAGLQPNPAFGQQAGFQQPMQTGFGQPGFGQPGFGGAPNQFGGFQR
ncbi:cytoskeletal protein binding protein [Tulasnella sp. 408]|nr:cytoskeletal protein binding protein [Tulasnella sp. 408]